MGFLFFETPIIAQGGGYDPCLAAPQSPSCLDGSRTCIENGEPIPACSEGYCWANGGIPINAGIPANGVVENKIIEIGGTYTVTQSVHFINCTFRMSGDARINISPAGSNVMKVKFDNCDLFGCTEMWQGIVVDASAATGGFLFTFFQNKVEGAYIGLRLDEGVANSNFGYQITGNEFRNNHIGVSSLRSNGTVLNAIFRQNHFFQTALLPTKVGSLQGVAMPGYPQSYAGVQLINTPGSVGINAVGQANLFNCLLNGIIALNGKNVINCVNNRFEKIQERGVWVADRRAFISNCTFAVSGGIGVFSSASNLTAQANMFEGNWVRGMHVESNLNAQKILINQQNSFNMTGSAWEYGIYAERPFAAFDAVSSFTIEHNTFNLTGGVRGAHCIYLQDFVNADDVAEINWNVITVNAPQSPKYGIGAILANSDNLWIMDNIITYGTVGDNFQSFGITLGPTDFDTQNASSGHIIHHNTITGPDVTSNGINCAIHTQTLQGVEYCNNILDYSYNGLHFRDDCGDVFVRQNETDHHTYGINIFGLDMPDIGKQLGRGNKWTIDGCIDKAIVHSVPNSMYVIPSLFRVPESSGYPFKPSVVRIDPNPVFSGANFDWFRFDDVPTDYCLGGEEPATPRALTFHEKQTVDGLSPFSGTLLWDLKYRTYNKLQFIPSLRPGGSVEEIFFNSQANTTIAYFGQVLQMLRNSFYIPASDQQAINGYQAALNQAVLNLKNWEAAQSYAFYENLTETWFATRNSLLQQWSVGQPQWATIESAHQTQVNGGLQAALSYNTNITTTALHETARKTLNDIWLRRLLQEPQTLSYYQGILSLAQQDPAVYGAAAKSAANFVAPCDRDLFPYEEEIPNSGNREDGKTTQVEASEVRSVIKVSPNPSSGLTEILVPVETAGRIQILDAQGRVLKMIAVQGDTRRVSMDLSIFPSGLYQAVFTDDGGKMRLSSPIILSR
ncbi:MAG: T9SS type A sorting domain-containing protein [Saprospiraceae bacterium]|nr:T9SS type A sorting domain-containing protein [Saprospiraceae bacterium]